MNITVQNYINGEFIEASSGDTLENISPATAEPIGTLPRSNAEDVQSAVSAAKAAFPAWKQAGEQTRSQWLLKMADAIRDRAEQLAQDESLDNGKPLTLAAEIDIPRAGQNFEFFAHAITQFASESHSMGESVLNYTLRKPLGVVGCISPWNLPLYLFTWKIAPALAAGNCVVAKPSEVTPLTAFRLTEICRDIGLPPGVLNVIHGRGDEAAAPFCSHPDVSAISFTGGTKTGESIAQTAAPLFKKTSLELGGKNPTIVFSDCDYEKTLAGVVRASFANQGQICLCGSRIYVHEELYERFRDDFVERVKQLRIGDPLEPDTDQGAIVSKAHHEKVLSCIELAKSEGGTILCGGGPVTVEGRCQSGYFIEPTVIEGLPLDCKTNQEEIFGPVVTVAPFKEEEEVTELANGVPYGLAASVWTTHLERAHRLAANLQAGVIWINCWLVRDLRTPFGGMKQSGIGREGGIEALRFFTEPKNVCVQL